MNAAAPVAAESALRRFRRAFAQPSAWTICLFGFGSGLPFLLIGVTLSYWLRERSMSLSSIGVVTGGFTMLYVAKVLWAPLLDRWSAPGFSYLGRRRGWLLVSQLGVAAGLAAMALIDVGEHARLFLAALAWTSFWGANQDCVVDAYRIEIASPEDQGALITTYSLGYRIGLLLAGAGALYAADLFGWQTTYLALAVLMLAPAAMTMFAREPAVPSPKPFGDIASRPGERGAIALVRTAIVAYFRPVIEFFLTNGTRLALALLLFVGLYKLPDQILGTMAGPYYLDSGFTKSQIATVSKVYGVWLGFAGALLGGIAATVLGVRRSLLIAALGVAFSNLVFLLMSVYPGQTWAFVAAISADNFCQGFAGSVLVAFMSGLADVRFSATQYALLASLANMPGKMLAMVSGFFVEAFGYQAFFIASAVSIVPTLCLYALLRDRIGSPAPKTG